MTQFTLGINNCFAVKRWPEPEVWAALVREKLDLDLVQFSFDLTELSLPAAARRRQAERVRRACEAYGLRLHSGFTGLAAYNANLLLSPDPVLRRWAREWYRRALAFAADLGCRAAGGHIGAMSEREYDDPDLRCRRREELVTAMGELTTEAAALGLDYFLVEPMPVARELTSTLTATDELLADLNRTAAVPVRLCLDTGHACAAGNSGLDRDPYEWLRRFGAVSPVVHIQQTDGRADCHHAFTERHNAAGIIEAPAVLGALRASGAATTDLILEVIHPFEADEATVLDELAASARYWREATGDCA